MVDTSGRGGKGGMIVVVVVVIGDGNGSKGLRGVAGIRNRGRGWMDGWMEKMRWKSQPAVLRQWLAGDNETGVINHEDNGEKV